MQPPTGTYKSGKLRAFRQDGGYWTVKDRRLVWEKPRVQMLYNVFSAHGEAHVTVEASRSGFNETIEFICIDVSTLDFICTFIFQCLQLQLTMLHHVCLSVGSDC